MSKEPVVMALAPVAHIPAHLPEGCVNPVASNAVATAVVSAVEAGVTVAHLHVRKENGELTEDMTVFTKTLDMIFSKTEVLINGSTGGVSDLTLEERCVSVNEPRVSIASLNMGSSNMKDGVYINRIPDIEFWAARMKDRQVVPELEIFAVSMMDTAFRMREEGLLPHRLHFNFCLGFPGALPAQADHLAYLVSLVPKGDTWGITHDGMTDFSLLACALGLGASVLRAGYEDGCWLEPGLPAVSNAELALRMADLIRICGKRPATLTEAQELFQTGSAWNLPH